MTKRNVWAVVVVILIIGLFWVSTAFSNYFELGVLLLKGYALQFPLQSMLTFLLLTVLSALLFSFSSVWLLPVAIGIWGKGGTFLLLLGGWVLGNIISYLIGMYAGYPLVKKFIPEKKLEHYKHLFLEGNMGFGIVFLSRFILPSEIPGYLLGILRYRFWPYFIATVLSEAPYALIAIYAVDAILKRDIILLLVWGAIWAFCALLLAKLIRKKLNRERTGKK